MTRQISALGQSQLAEWEKIAKEWLLVPTTRINEFAFSPEKADQLHLCCARCELSVYAVSRQTVTPAVLQAATVAHIRQFHRELDPDA